MKFTALLSLLVIGASSATMAKFSKAADTTIYRSGDFGRANDEIISCVGYALIKQNPKLHYFTWASAGAFRSGEWSTSSNDFIWTITAKPTGPKSSHVELRNKEAKPELIQEVWQIIAGCAKQ